MAAIESGIASLRLNFIREATVGTTPTNPAWLRFSDEVDAFGPWNFDAGLIARRGAGSPNVTGFSKGAEDHTFTVTYSLQRWIAAAGDPSYDGLIRATDGSYGTTHSVFARQQLVGTQGTNSGGTNLYTYATGAYIDSVNIAGNPADGEPVKVTLTYRAKHVRSFRIDQPAADGVLTVVSTSASDTGGPTVTIDDGIGSTEAEALTGTTPATTSTSYAQVDAVRLSAECVGDVIIKKGSDEICRILGKTSNGGATSQGDLGMPLIGSGSYEGAIGSAFEHVIDDTVTFGGSTFEMSGESIMTSSVDVSNNLSADAVVGSRRKNVNAGNRDISVGSTIFSESGSHDAFVNHCKATAGNIVWTFGGGAITVTSAVLTGLGGRVHTKGEAMMRRDNTFTGQSLTVA